MISILKSETILPRILLVLKSDVNNLNLFYVCIKY